MFAILTRVETDRVGLSDERTNPLSALLMESAGNPWDTYEQEESCVHSGGCVGRPPSRPFSRRMLSALAERMNRVQLRFSPSRPAWIDCLYRRPVS